jgi:hypothetical protein
MKFSLRSKTVLLAIFLDLVRSVATCTWCGSIRGPGGCR